MINCPLCQSPTKSLFVANDFITHQDFSVLKCEQCNVGITWSQPNDLNEFYPSDYRTFAPFTRWLLQNLYRSAVKSWIRNLGFSGKALEIGCGNGWMLNALSENGWEVMGFERNEEQAKRVARDCGFQVFSGDLGQIKDQKFDLILLFNVIEHLSHPKEVLQQCRELLTERGVLILNAPNLTSWQSRLTGPDWAHLDVPRHLFHFSQKSFEVTLESCGMEITRVYTVSWIHDPYGWVASLLNRIGFEKNRLTRELTRKNFKGFLNFSGVLLALGAVVLAVPSLILSLLSWCFKSGALIEVWAKRK